MPNPDEELDSAAPQIDDGLDEIQVFIGDYIRKSIKASAIKLNVGINIPGAEVDHDADVLQDKIDLTLKSLEQAAYNLRRQKTNEQQRSINQDTPCARCRCSKIHHNKNGACQYCFAPGMRNTCYRFIPPGQNAYRFFDFTKWAKAWLKHRSRRTAGDLSKIWAGFHDTSYLSYCGKCSAPTIINEKHTRNTTNVQDGLTCQACAMCNDCCKCPVCPRCAKKCSADATCKKCNMCDNGKCCKCLSCRACKIECGDDNCYDCLLCNKCCQCTDKCRVPFYTSYNRKIKFHKPTLKQHSLNSTSRFIAAEIEVAGIRGYGKSIYETTKKWDAAIVRDGSLPAGGFELNTSPAGGDLFVEQVKELCNSVNEQLGFVNGKCGLHIHVDGRDLDFFDIRMLIRLYAVIEDVMFRMLPEDRKESIYCRPCGNKYLQAVEDGRLPYEKVKADVINAIYKVDTTQGRRSNKYNLARRVALNLHSWLYRGTIECRMFNGTIDADTIYKWGVIWARFVDFVISKSDDEIDLLIRDRDGLSLLLEICGSRDGLADFVRERLRMFEVKKAAQ